MIKKVDIAHSGQTVEQALILLETAISKAKVEPGVIGVKVVHGLGAGKIAEKVRRLSGVHILACTSQVKLPSSWVSLGVNYV